MSGCAPGTAARACQAVARHARLAGMAALALILLTGGLKAEESVLRVCADPNNLPFSNRAGEGFENRIISLIAADMAARVEYTWWAQRRGFARNTLDAGTCDVWPGVASAVEHVSTTRPYYRSSYVFVTRAERGLDIHSFDDPRLAGLTIGVQMVGDDGANTPPAHALARRGHVANVRGYMLYGNYRDAAPSRAIIDAVAGGDIDVAVAWGPLAGYFAARSTAVLRTTPVLPASDGAHLPMSFSVSMGVSKGNEELRARLDGILARRAAAIRQILSDYGVPLVAAAPLP